MNQPISIESSQIFELQKIHQIAIFVENSLDPVTVAIHAHKAYKRYLPDKSWLVAHYAKVSPI